MNKKLRKKIFGRSFDIWDVLLLVIVIGFPIYLFQTQGITVFIEDFGWAIYGSVVTALIIKMFMKKVRK